ncbi:MAG: hypothetical protein ACD_79C00672G0007 [uncultured bacterium]|nr:MAG: hypothetical protein ACD_79C00672G0007 [uncultured bacterium]
MKLETKNFDNLDFDKQCQIISSSPVREKGDLILRSQNPEVIIPSLPCEEFYVVYSSSSQDIHSELISHANSEQISFVSDFQCWDKDEINSSNFLNWLGTLKNADNSPFQKWIVEADFELVVSCFIKFTEVIKTEHLELIDDYIGDRPFFSLDGLYYICIDGDNFEVLRESIEVIYGMDKKLYMTLMESLICANEIEVLEEAYTLRNQRLASYGFPEKDEAMQIYVNIDDWSAIEERSVDIDKESSHMEIKLPSVISENKLYLNEVMNIYYERYQEDHTIETELIWLANKIIVCNELDFRDVETLESAYKRANNVVSLALEDLSHGKIQIAVDMLKTHWIETLHRWGITRLRQLSQFAENIFEESSFDSHTCFMGFLGSPWESQFKGLLKFYPMKAKSNSDTEIIEFEDFSNLKEVKIMFNKLQDLKNILEFLKNKYAEDFKSFQNRKKSIKNFNSLIAGLIINSANKLPVFDKVTEIVLKDFVKTAFDNTKPFRKLKESVKSKIMETIYSNSDSMENHPVLENIFSRIEEEIGNLDTNSAIEMKYISIL